MHKHSRK